MPLFGRLLEKMKSAALLCHQI
jgi:hypothetical protein